MVKKIENYQQALNYVLSSIPHGKLKFPGDVGIKRQKLLLGFLGSPQNKIKIIHVAGTSGKGSFVNYLSSLLTAHGFKVGTTTSPHILNIRERIQIDKKLITEDEFTDYVKEIIPAVEKTKLEGIGSPTYFEIMIAMAFLYFYKNKVDYAVVETGMGGLFDGTNTIDSENKLAVITRLGFDHTNILGNKITDIAYQKSGIIQNKNKTVALWQRQKIRTVLENRASEKLTQIEYVKKNENFKNIKQSEAGIEYDFKFDGLVIKKLELHNFALYQVENSALALTVIKVLSKRDKFEIKTDLVKTAIENYNFVGRMEIIKTDKKTVILDGAHNPQKMSNFIRSLTGAFSNKKFIFVIAFKQRKDFPKMIEMMIPIASQFIFTSFVVTDEDMIQRSQPPEDLIRILDKSNFKNYEVIMNPDLAFKTALEKSDNVVVTSSFYLLRKIYPKILLRTQSINRI